MGIEVARLKRGIVTLDLLKEKRKLGAELVEASIEQSHGFDCDSADMLNDPIVVICQMIQGLTKAGREMYLPNYYMARDLLCS